MTLLSVPFFVALALAAGTFQLVRREARALYLLIASGALYACFGWAATVLLFALTACAFVLALKIEPKDEGGTPDERGDGDDRRAGGSIALALGLVVPLGVLFCFKYVGPSIGGMASFGVPLGLSYYVFRLVSYVLDVHWGKQRAERSFVAFAAYVSFFPQIVSGPIQRSESFLEQLRAPAAVSAEMMRGGLRLILFGLFEKLVVADRLGALVDHVFDDPRSAMGLAFPVAAYAFAFQLYADFSGLTDIALGVGRFFGIEGPPNFDSPFYSPNIQAFWRRWHMSLTSWLTDYLFFPLHMSFRSAGNLGLAAAILINMIAVAMWHGARWTFFAFGLLHGAFMIVSAFTLKRRNAYYARRPVLARYRKVLGPLVTFHLVVVSFVFFRATSIADALYVLRHLAPTHPSQWLSDLRGLGLRQNGIALPCVVAMEVVHLTRRSGALARWLTTSPTWMRWGVYYAGVFAVLAASIFQGGRNFIYAGF